MGLVTLTLNSLTTHNADLDRGEVPNICGVDLELLVLAAGVQGLGLTRRALNLHDVRV